MVFSAGNRYDAIMPHDFRFFDFPTIIDPCLAVLRKAGWTHSQIDAAKDALFNLFNYLNTVQIGQAGPPLVLPSNSDIAEVWNLRDRKERTARLAAMGLTENEAERIYKWCMFEKGQIWYVPDWQGISILFIFEPYQSGGPEALAVKWERILP